MTTRIPGITPQAEMTSGTRRRAKRIRISTHRHRSSAERQTIKRHPAASPTFLAEAVDWELLQWLLRCPLLRIDDLATFCGMSRTTISRRLDEMATRGLIENVTPACLTHQGTERCYHLSDLGIRVLAAACGSAPQRLARSWRTDERRLLTALPRIRQLVRMHAFVGGMLVGAQRALGERGHRVRGAWHWVRDYSHPFRYREHPLRLKLDAVVTLRVTGQMTGRRALHPGTSGTSARPTGVSAITSSAPTDDDLAREESYIWEPVDRWYSILLLADHQVQDWDAASRALDTLLSYRECPERWKVYDAFPPVLILAESVRHLERWLHLAREVAIRRRLPPLAGAVAVIPDVAIPRDSAGPSRSRGSPAPHTLDNPWRLAWHDLATGGRVQLSTIVRPLPRMALLQATDGWEGTLLPDPEPQHVISVTPSARRVLAGHYQERAVGLVAATSTEVTPPSPTTSPAARPVSTSHLLALSLALRFHTVLELLFITSWIHLSDLADLLGVRLSSLDRYVSVLDRHGLLMWSTEALPTSWRTGSGTSGTAIEAQGGGTSQSKERVRRVRPERRERPGDVRSETPTWRTHLSHAPADQVCLSTLGQQLVAASQQIGPRSRLAWRAMPTPPIRHHIGRTGSADIQHVVERTDVDTDDEVSDDSGRREDPHQGDAERALSGSKHPLASTPAQHVMRRRTAHSTGVYHFFALLARAAMDEASQHTSRDDRRAELEYPERPNGSGRSGQHAREAYGDTPLRRAVGNHPAARLVWWETGPVCEDRYRYQGHWHNLRPDGAGLYLAGTQRFRFWLEWDLGTMNLGDLIRKFAAYATYLASGQWRERALDHVIPHLLIVVQERGQFDRMFRAAAAVFAPSPSQPSFAVTRSTLDIPAEVGGLEHAGRVGRPEGPAGRPIEAGRLIASITFAHRLDDAGPLAPIWWPLLPLPLPGSDGHTQPASYPAPRPVFPLVSVPISPAAKGVSVTSSTARSGPRLGSQAHA